MDYTYVQYKVYFLLEFTYKSCLFIAINDNFRNYPTSLYSLNKKNELKQKKCLYLVSQNMCGTKNDNLSKKKYLPHGKVRNASSFIHIHNCTMGFIDSTVKYAMF